MAKVEYKFKPYKPRKFKLASVGDTTNANLKSLQTQKENLEKRLLAEGVDPETLGGEFDNRTGLGKLFNVTPNQNLLFDVIEVLDRPTQMVKQAILAGSSGENILEAALEGLSGERDRVEGTELLEKLGVETGDTPVEQFVTNIVTDIVLDPLTYLPAGILTKGFKKLTTKTRTAFLDVAAETQEALIRRLSQANPEKSVDEILEMVALQKTDEVYRLGSKGDFDGTLYVKKDRAKTLGGNYRNSIEGLEGRAVTLNEIIEARKIDPTAFPEFPKVYNYVENEVKIYNNLKAGIEATDPGNIRVVMTTTQNRLSDVVILKRYGNTDYFTQVGKIETKMLEAMGSTATIEPIIQTVKNASGSTEEVIKGFKISDVKKPFDINNTEQVIDFVRKNPDDIKIVQVGQNPSDIKISGSTMDENQFLDTIRRRFPEVKSLDDIRNNKTILDQLLPWERQQILSGGANGVFVGGPRAYVLVEYRGQRIPFYLSSGSAGKKAAAGVWYPYMGLSSGWINKGTDAQIQAFYNNPVFEAISEHLGKKFPAQALQEDIVKRISTSGQLGRVTSLDDSARQAINSIFPENPSLSALDGAPAKNVKYFTETLPKNIKNTFKTPKQTAVPKPKPKPKVDSTEEVITGFKFSGSEDAFDFDSIVPGLNKRFTDFLNKPLDATNATIRDRLIEIYKAKKGSVSVIDIIKDNPTLMKEYRDIVFDMMKAKGTKILAFAGADSPIYMTLEQARKHIKLGKRGFEFGSGSGPIVRIIKTSKGDDAAYQLVRGTGKKQKAVSKQVKEQIEKLMGQGMSVEEAVEAFNASKRQFRIFPAIGVDEEVLDAINKSGDFIKEDDIVQQFAKQEFTYEIGLLEWLGERDDLIGLVARKLDTFFVNFKNLFSFKGDLPDDFITAVKGIEGQAMYRLQRSSERLAAIKRKFLEVDPASGVHLSALFEAGAYIDKNGVLRRLDRSYDAASFFDYAYKRYVDGRDIILPEFADAAARDNFILEYNRRYYDYGNMVRESRMSLEQLRAKNKLVFDIVESNGATKMVVKGNIDNGTLKEFTTYIGNAVDNPYVKFGQKRLNKDAIKLIKENPELYKEFADLQDELIRDLITEGGFTDLPKELSGRIGYMRHIMTKESYEALRLTLPNVASKFSKPGQDLLTNRTIFGSIDEINRALREFAGLDVDLFDPDAFNTVEDLIKVAQRKIEQKQMLSLVLNSRGKRGERLFRVVPNNLPKDQLIANETLIKSFDDEFSVLYKNLSEGSQAELKSILATMGYGPGSAIAINKNVKDILKRVEKAYIDLPDFIKKYDKFLNTWKGLTLITPGFHMRNFFGNMFNSYAVGMGVVDQSRYATIAMKELKMFDDVAKKIAKGLEITAAEKQVFDLVSDFFSSGVAQTHRGIRDLEQLKEAVAAAAKGKAGGLKTGYNNLIRLNFNFAEKMDDFQRYMLYRWSLDKTGDAVQASRTVSEALFDYHHLTNFEKDYMKRLFPFYTFMKNNFVFQAKNILRNPGAYARVGRAYEYYLEDIAGIGPDELPNYATENMWLPIPMSVDKNDKESIAFLKANLPLSDFIELVENPFKKGAVSITAPAKLLIEFGVGRDLFTGQPLEDFPGQTNMMEPGTGVLSGMRDSRGNFTLSKSPLFQKIMNDLGLRNLTNIASVPLDIVDSLSGYQGDQEGVFDFLQRAGVTGTLEQEKIDLNTLYRDLEYLRELKKYYEQQTGNQLPVLPRG